MGNRLRALLVFVVLLLAGAVAWTVATVPDPPDEQGGEPAEPRLMEYGSNTIREEQNGRLVWEIAAESTYVDVGTQDTVFKDVTARYYMDDGNVLTLTAPSGSYRNESRDVRLTGGVTATTTDGARLTGDELEWIAGEGRLVAKGSARASRQDLSVSGDTVEAWDEFTSFRASGGARVEKLNAKRSF